jgi:hypothetical protein
MCAAIALFAILLTQPASAITWLYTPESLSSIDGRYYNAAANPQRLMNITVFHQGTGAVSQNITDWNLGTYTGVTTPSPLGNYQRGIDNSTPGSCAVQAVGTQWGSVIDTASVTENPASYNYKNNVSLRYGFGGGSPVYPWATTVGSFNMSFDLKVPTATFVSGTVPHVYASISVIDPNGQFISIQPNMYDPRGALTEFSGWDPVGNAAYVHSSFTSSAKFISILPGSSTIATTTWNDWRYFSFSITGDELLTIINKINRD